MILKAFDNPDPHRAVPLPPQPLELTACYSYCEALARARTHNYPVASLFAPSQVRRHIHAVYAFARCADDFADEPEYDGRRARELDRWEERLHSCYYGEPPDHPVFVALADTVKRYELPITEFSALITGFRADLDRQRYNSMTDLRSYTALSAEPFGRLLLYLGGYREPALLRYVEDLCSGLAMARMLQDLPANYERGRIYIPEDDLHHFRVTEDDIANRRATTGVGALVRYQVAHIRGLFERARPLVEEIGNNYAIEMALIWHGGMRILDKIDAVGKNILRQRPKLNSFDKAQVVLRSLAWRGDSAPPRLADRLTR